MNPALQSDEAARERIRHSLHESLIVEASAGTGKTSELTRRIVNVLAAGITTVDKIAAVTFTNKAAGELKIRLRQELDDARANAPSPLERDNLECALQRLEEAFVGTIHSFCAMILRERPVEARVDPAFEEITEAQGARLFQEAFQRWFARKLNADAPALRRALARLAWPDPWDDSPPVERLSFAGRKLLEWRDFPAPWRRELFDRKKRVGELCAEVERVAKLAGRTRNANDPLAASMRPLNEFLVRTFQKDDSEQRDIDTLEALLIRLRKDLDAKEGRGRGILYAEGLTREEMIRERDTLRHDLVEFETRSGADLAAQLREEFRDLIDDHEHIKLRAGKLDFLDLLIRVRDLVRDNGDVRRYLQGRFTHLFVDEFQDTDPLQAETILLLSSNDPTETDWLNITPAPGKLFAVGDPKQSIYKFRRADVSLYRQLREALAARGAGLVKLTKSYRSVRPIQEFVNAAFSREMTGDVTTGQAEYSNLEEHWPAPENQPSVIALPVPRPWGQTRITKTAINQSLPPATAAFIDWLLNESGWTVRDPEHPSDRVPIAPRHVCILMRRFMQFRDDITRPYVHELEKRGVPHVLVGSKSFHKREEVETLRAALTAIEWPDDELSVFATLRGYLFAIDDSMLLRYRSAHKRLNPFAAQQPEEPEFAPVVESLALLKELHRHRNRRPVAETLNAMLEASRAHASFALRPAGPQVLANVQRVAELARTYETSGGISFRGFVEELAAQADRSDSSEAPVLEHAAEGVRIMTVHTAKGLEFPVVILADITANVAAKDADRFLDPANHLCATRLLGCVPHELHENEADELARERSEGIRVAYVAATRARDLLVVPAVGDERFDGWVGALNPALYPKRTEYRKKQTAPGCPPFPGYETVLDRPFPVHDEDQMSVHPGLHRAEAGGHEVVWWDPMALHLDAEERHGLQQEDLLRKSEPQASEGIAAHERWHADRDATVQRGAQPSTEVLLASTATADPPSPVSDPRFAITEVPFDRPASHRFGTLVHLILRDCEWDGANAGDLANLHGELLEASVDEIDAAERAAIAAIDHPLMERARKATRRVRELPLTLRLDECRVVEGAIDLAFIEDGRWVIVDFKTTADIARNRSGYERQLRWYAYMLDRIQPQQRPAETWLFSV